MHASAQLLHDSLAQLVEREGDVYVGADMPIVPTDGGPLLQAMHLVALGRSPHARREWLCAIEGAPSVVIALGASAADVQRYADLGARELFNFDPTTRALTGYWLGPGGFARISPGDDPTRLPCEELRLVLGLRQVPGQEPELRWFKRDGTLIETPAETEALRQARISKLIETRRREEDDELRQ